MLTLAPTSNSDFYVDCGARCAQTKKSSKIRNKNKPLTAVKGLFMASEKPDDIKQISDLHLSIHTQRLNRDFEAFFGRPRKVEHHPITSNAEDWLKPKEKPNG